MRVRARGPSGREIVLDDGLLAPHRELLAHAEERSPARLCFAAAHVAMSGEYAASAHSPAAPGAADEIASAIDWETTLALRRRLDALGFGVAEAMDTAQRFELGWPAAERLIRACGELRLAHGFVAGAAADHVLGVTTRDALIAGVAHQARFIQHCGGIPIVLPMPWLARRRTGEDEYVEVYGAILEELEGPVLLHWLGADFLPELAGYFPGRSLARILARDAEKVRGVKLSLLDPAREVAIRRELLARDQIVLTGDDLNFGHLIAGGDAADWSIAPIERESALGGHALPLGDFSHALLGILDAIAEPASLALAHLARGDAARYRALMEPCEALGRHLFAPPVSSYKAGLAFLAWLNGLQPNPMLPNHLERTREREHYLRAAELASAASALRDVNLAAERLGDLQQARGSP